MIRNTVELEGKVFPENFVEASMTPPVTSCSCPFFGKEDALDMGELHDNDAKRTGKITFKLGFRTMEVDWIRSVVIFWDVSK